jgi:excisionase family DNA binding protein
MAEPDELLSVADIAAELEMNQQTIRDWIDSGYLPAIRIGRRVRVRRSDFDALLEASYTGTKQPLGRRLGRRRAHAGGAPRARGGRGTGARQGGGEVGQPTAMPTTLKFGASARALAITGTARPESWRIRAGSEPKTNRGRLGARS